MVNVYYNSTVNLRTVCCWPSLNETEQETTTESRNKQTDAKETRRRESTHFSISRSLRRTQNLTHESCLAPAWGPVPVEVGWARGRVIGREVGRHHRLSPLLHPGLHLGQHVWVLGFHVKVLRRVLCRIGKQFEERSLQQEQQQQQQQQHKK